jgi:hypothetical protein
MATYYVRPDGSDTNTGLGSTTALAWATFGKAFTAGSPVTGGDIVYIAPGTYTEVVSIASTSPSSEVRIIGNPTASQFIGITPAPVRLSVYNSSGTSLVYTNSSVISGVSKSNFSFENIHFDCNGGTSYGVTFTNARYIKFKKCLFTNNSGRTNNLGTLRLSSSSSTALDAEIDQCIFAHCHPDNSTYNPGLYIAGSSVLVDSSVIKNCLFAGCYMNPVAITMTVINCTIIGTQSGIFQQVGSSNAIVTVQNCLFANCQVAITGTSTSTISQTYCRFVGNATNLTNCNTSVTSQTTGNSGIDYGYAYMQGLNPLVPYGSYSGSPNTSFGNSSNAPLVDLYNNSWSGLTPDAGAVTFKSMTGVSSYLPGNQTASTITIAPGSTSQSIELYLGATGLTASTSGLTARYNRTRTASVSIPLVARTIAQAWTAGGFAEVDATNMPGVYRLDLPDAALAAGADDVTIVVRGASGTNGAVMTVKLSSGGLTEAQTASAVLDAVGSSYVTAGSIGYAIQNSNVASISGSTAAADELEGALLHNGTDYISAELVTPVTSAALVRMGPFEVKADGLGASDPLDIQKGAQHGIDIQCVDNNGAGIDITSATVTAKVYNSGATLVDTYSCTATYAADGRATFTIDTTVTNTPGTYTATITRTTGASDTQVFGPLRIYVRDI